MNILIINANSNIKGGNDFVAFQQKKILEDICEVQMFTSNKSIIKFTNYFFSLINLVRLWRKLVFNNFDFIFVHSYAGKLSNSILVNLKFSKATKMFFVHDYKIICPVSSMYRYSRTEANYINCDECPKSKSIQPCLTNKCNRQSLALSFINFIDFKISSILKPEIIFDKYVFVSDFTKNKILQYKTEIKNKSILLYNSIIDISAKNNSIKSIKDFDFVFIGRVSMEKGIYQFCNYLNESKFKGKILIIGEGPLVNRINSEFSEFAFCVGFKSGTEKTNLLLSAKYLIFPSLWHENNPIVLIEAMCLGVPVIAKALGGVPEIIRNNYNGFLYNDYFDFQEALKHINNLSVSDFEQIKINCRNTYLDNFCPSKLINFIKNQNV